MAEIKKIHRAVEMSPVKRDAFVDLIKIFNGVATEKGGIYLSKVSTLLDPKIEREVKKCSQLDSGLTNAIMLLYGQPGLGNADDYESLDFSKAKDEEFIRDRHSQLDEDKISEAISLAEDIVDNEDIPGVKGLLLNGIEKVKDHLMAFRPIWQEYEDYAKPFVRGALVGKNRPEDEDKEERHSRGEIENAFTADNNKIARLEEEIKRKTEDLKRLEERVLELKQRNMERAELLGKTIEETREETEEVVGGNLFYLPTRPGEMTGSFAEHEDSSQAALMADLVAGRDIAGEIRRKGDKGKKVVPFKRRDITEEIPDENA